MSQQPPIPPKRERKTVRSHLPPGTGVLECRRGMVSAPGAAAGVWDGTGCSVPGQRGGTGLCPHRLEGLAREPGCTVGAGDLGRPSRQRCAESQLPGGRGCRGCQLLSAPGDAGARRPRTGPIYSGEPGACRGGPVPGAGSAAGKWGAGISSSAMGWALQCCCGSRSCSEGGGNSTPGCSVPCTVGVPA